MSFKMGELAQGIASTWDAQVLYKGDSDTYSFMLDTTKMRAICGSDLSGAGLQQRCRDFMEQYQSAQRAPTEAQGA